ncbi:GNAT family N-acetyltransferase [Litorimonas sp. RW-G-Af-16]|uniref:GNAT family N-acetyltransferase n=1 Tax=Litorimonas sp. RW-G-Af-16 TaxID=3241168 RepID=UPI00390CC3A0
MRLILHTDRLVLRPWRHSDAPEFARLASDLDVARMTGSFPHPMPEMSAEFKITHMLARQRMGKAHPYVITQPNDDRLMGTTDLFDNGETNSFEIGYWLGKPHQGHGYATEAVTAVIQEARNTLGTQTITAGVFTDNPASLRVLQKLGFEITGMDDNYFSMARMTKAPSHILQLDLAKSHLAMASEDA